jgi:hypothetical protein
MMTFLGSILLLSVPWNAISFSATAKMAARRNMQIFSVQDESDRFVNRYCRVQQLLMIRQ